MNIDHLLNNRLQEACREEYGLIAQPRDPDAMMQFLSFILNNMTSKKSGHRSIEKQIEQIIKKSGDFLSLGLPLCQRPKS